MNVKYLILLCWMWLSMQASLSAQTHVLEGRVRSESSPLAGVSLSLPGLARATVSDAEGRYVFDSLPGGSHTLELRYLGSLCHQQMVSLDAPRTRLDLDVVATLDPVLIEEQQEATYGLSRLRSVEGVAIYEGKKSEVVQLRDLAANLAANNPRQLYARIAGLNIWESDGAGIQLGIGGRGLSPNRTANFNTRQNGYDISADALGYPESYYTPPAEALDQIQVVRGAASLQYGTQFGGMLNFVFNKAPSDRAFSLASRQTAGAFGYLGSYNQVAGTLAGGRFSYFGYYQYKQGDGWRPYSGFRLHNGYTALHWQPGARLRLGLEFTHMNYLAQQPGGLTDALFAQDARAAYRSRNWFRVDWNLAALTLAYRLSERTRLESRTFGLLAGRQALGILSPVTVIDFGGPRDLIDGQFRNIGNETRLLHRYRLGRQEQIFVVGVRAYRGQTRARQGQADDGSGPDFAFLRPDNVDLSDFRFPSTNYAAFVEHIFFLGKAWSLTPGIRYEYIHTRSEGYYQQRVFDAAGNLVAQTRLEDRQTRTRDLLLAGLGASWKPGTRQEWYANISQNYRAINFSDLRIDNPNLRVDPGIGDERGYTADIGWRTRGRGWLYADVTVFYIAYRDRIGQVLRSGEPPLYNDYRLRTNIADARNAGIESFAEGNLWRFVRPADTLTLLSLFVNASLIDARYIRTDDLSIRGRRVELVPPLTLRTGLRLQRGAWRASLIWAYTAAHYTDATNARRTASAVNGIIPAYAVADASAGWQGRWLSVEASCNNLLDARYFTRRAEAYPGPGIIPADGRGWFLTVGVRY
ncbi:MAG: TonB-dependent receptor [Bacteroidia bacterium]